MSSITHVNEMNLSQTKDFEFILLTDTLPRSVCAPPQRNERTPAAARLHSASDESSLNAFHEEFKSLVLASDKSSPEDLLAESLIELFDVDEIEWSEVMERAEINRPSIAPLAARKTVTPRQVVRPTTAPQLGTPMPIETWVVKVIVVLVGLNLLFAGFIVASARQ